jgi:hypothetical protein
MRGTLVAGPGKKATDMRRVKAKKGLARRDTPPTGRVVNLQKE